MRFYNRENEIKALLDTAERAKEHAQMTFVVGRRRIGKTAMILKAFEDRPFVYLFITRKAEGLLCQEFCQQIEAQLSIKLYGHFDDFPSLFGYLLELSCKEHFTLVIDEFQEFFSLNASIYSSMQNLWDRYKDKSHLNLVCLGSIYSLMNKIFENHQEPLYGRANQKIKLGPLALSVQKEILQDNSQVVTSEDLLGFYMVTGGIPKYIELLVQHKALSFDKIINVFFEQHSIFIHEGKDILIEEFGKDYTTYFSILSLIASSKTYRSEIESILQKGVGGYLDKLEKHYGLIQTIKPILAKPESRIQKYCIKDNFLNFWFRFCYKNLSALEISNYDYVKSIVKQDYPTYSGMVLEKYFRQKFSESGDYNIISSYWEKKNQNEIDLVALNQHKKKAVIVEVKRNKEKIDINQLKEKAKNLVAKQLKGYAINYQGLSLEDV